MIYEENLINRYGIDKVLDCIINNKILELEFHDITEILSISSLDNILKIDKKYESNIIELLKNNFSKYIQISSYSYNYNSDVKDIFLNKVFNNEKILDFTEKIKKYNNEIFIDINDEKCNFDIIGKTVLYLSSNSPDFHKYFSKEDMLIINPKILPFFFNSGNKKLINMIDKKRLYNMSDYYNNYYVFLHENYEKIILNNPKIFTQVDFFDVFFENLKLDKVTDYYKIMLNNKKITKEEIAVFTNYYMDDTIFNINIEEIKIILLKLDISPNYLTKKTLVAMKNYTEMYENEILKKEISNKKELYNKKL